MLSALSKQNSLSQSQDRHECGTSRCPVPIAAAQSQERATPHPAFRCPCTIDCVQATRRFCGTWACISAERRAYILENISHLINNGGGIEKQIQCQFLSRLLGYGYQKSSRKIVEKQRRSSKATSQGLCAAPLFSSALLLVISSIAAGKQEVTDHGNIDILLSDLALL